MRRKALITGFGATLLLILGLALFLYFNFKTVMVTGYSMEPTYHNRDRVLVSRAYWLIGGIKRGDVIVFRSPTGEEVIKRVYGLPGDKIDFLNIPDDWSLADGEYRVPNGTYYVIGDNRQNSEDSRKFGPVKHSDILGKVISQR